MFCHVNETNKPSNLFKLCVYVFVIFNTDSAGQCNGSGRQIDFVIPDKLALRSSEKLIQAEVFPVGRYC